MDTEGGIVILAIVDAVLAALFFLFRVLPWSEPGPWWFIWLTATLSAAFFTVGELSAMVRGGGATAFEIQGPLFAAILAMTAAFVLVYTNRGRIAERERARATIDDLTQLPNKLAFTEQLIALLKLPGTFALAYVHLDGLETINDLFGAQRGDMLVRAVADQLRARSDPGDFLARLGGDDFGVLFVGPKERAADILGEVKTGVRAVAIRDFAGVDVWLSVGIAPRSAASDPGRLIHLAYREMRAGSRREQLPTIESVSREDA